MKFSLFMMPCHHPGENPTLAFQRDIGLIHYAEELGFDEAYIGEHHSGGWETHPAPEMSLSMAAATARPSLSAGPMAPKDTAITAPMMLNISMVMIDFSC